MKKFLLTVRDIAAILVLTVVCMMISGLWLDSWEINKMVLPLHYFCAPLIEIILFLLGFRFLKRRLFRDSFPSVSFPPVFHRRYFGYALGLVAVCAIGTMVIGGKLVYPDMDSYLFAQNAASLLGTFLIAPFVEETVFRVVILTQVSKRYGVKAGVIVSSLLFGAVHLMNGGLNLSSAVQLIVGGTLMGLVLSVAYVKEGSVWASYTIHALYNGIGSIIPAAVAATPDWPAEFILKNKSQLITGGQYGIDCSLMNIVAYILMIVLLLVLLHRQGLSLKTAWNRNSD